MNGQSGVNVLQCVGEEVGSERGSVLEVAPTVKQRSKKNATVKTVNLNLNFEVGSFICHLFTHTTLLFLCDWVSLLGLQHGGCYYVPAYSSVLFFLEGTTVDLSDNPLLREEPIRKCGTAAQELRLDTFAVSVGYCISGSNDLSDYQTYPSLLCENGEGQLACV